MNQRQIADVLGISSRQIRNLTKQGVLTRSESGDYDVRTNVLSYTAFKEDRYSYRPPEPEIDLGEIDEWDMSAFDEEAQHKQAVALFNEARNRLNESMTLEDFTFTDTPISKEEAQEDIISSNTVNGTLALVLEGLCGAFPSEQWPLLIKIVEGQMHDRDLLQETFDDY